MKPAQKQERYLQLFRAAIQTQREYPIGTVAYYGPDDQTVTKVVAAVLPDEQTNPILKKWTGVGVGENPETVADIGAFFREYQVKNVVVTEGIIGCPHEAGVDYPLGESCPECTYWQGE